MAGQQLNSNIGGVGAEGAHLELITRAALIAKRNASQLEYGIPGVDKIYQVTDPDSITNNLNLQVVQLRANSANTFEPIGQAKYWYPDHQLDSVSGDLITNYWKSESLRTAMGSPAYALNDVVVYANLRFKNITGTNTDTDPFDDAVNWDVLVPSLGNGYIEHWNEVVYNLDQDLIIYRREDIVNTNIFGAGAFWANGMKTCQNEVWLDETLQVLMAANNITFFEWGCAHDCRISGGYNARSIRANDSVKIDYGCLVSLNEDVKAYSMFVMSGSIVVASGKVNIHDLHVGSFSNLDYVGDYTTGIGATKNVVHAGSNITVDNSGTGVVSMGNLNCGNSTINILEELSMAGCIMSGVDFTLNTGGANHVMDGSVWQGGTVTVVIQNMTGTKDFKAYNSMIHGEVTLTVDDTECDITSSTIDSGNSITVKGGGDVHCLNTRIGKNQNAILIYCITLINMNAAVIEGRKETGYTWVFTDFITEHGVGNREVRKGDGNMFVTLPEPTATAYNGATTYSLGSTVASGTKDFIYINATPGSGNAPPASGRNAHWAEYWDSATNTYIVPQEATWAGIMLFNFAAPLTIDSLQGLYDDFNTILIAENAAVTLTRVPLASAVSGDIVLNVAADFVLDNVNKKIFLSKSSSDDINYEVFRMNPT